MANKVSFIIQLKDQFGRTATKVNQQFKNIKQSADKANRSVRNFAKKAQASLGKLGRKAARTGAIMTAALTVPIALMARQLINAASDAQETADKFRVMFSEVKGAGDAAVRLSDKYKLASSTSKELLASTGAIISASGMNKDRVLELSEEVGGLSIDLASMHNFTGTAAEATMILSKALLGEAESLKTNFGITILQNKEFQKAIKQKQRLTGVTQQAAKAEVIFANIMRQAKAQKAVDNFNETIGSYANVARISAEANKEMAESFGNLLLPIATKMTHVLIKLAKWVQDLSPGMKKLVLVLAGLVAIGGPLLLILGGIAVAFSVITLPILAIGAAVLAVTAIITAAVVYWEEITGFFSDIWEGAKTGLVNFVNVGIKAINQMLTPLNAVREALGFDSFSIAPMKNFDANTIDITSTQAPSAPIQGSNGTLSGQITVAATAGTQIKETSLKSTGSGLNIGMNMATQ